MKLLRKYYKILHSNNFWLLTGITYLIFIALMILEIGYMRPTKTSLLFDVIKILPLFLPVYGYLNQQKKSCIWLCFILFFYFIAGVQSIFVHNQWFDWLYIFICVLLFSLLIATVKKTVKHC